VLIEVKDDGSGIARDDLPRLFDPFFTRRRDDSGTGLGLFVSQGLANALGGRLSAHSDGPGCGAAFTLRVPRRMHAAPPANHTQGASNG